MCRVVKLMKKKIKPKTRADTFLLDNSREKTSAKWEASNLWGVKKCFCVNARPPPSLLLFSSKRFLSSLGKISRINNTGELPSPPPPRNPKRKNIQINLPSSSDGKVFLFDFQRISFNQWKALKRRKHEIGKDSTNLNLKLCRANFRSASSRKKSWEFTASGWVMAEA